MAARLAKKDSDIAAKESIPGRKRYAVEVALARIGLRLEDDEWGIVEEFVTGKSDSKVRAPAKIARKVGEFHWAMSQPAVKLEKEALVEAVQVKHASMVAQAEAAGKAAGGAAAAVESRWIELGNALARIGLTVHDDRKHTMYNAPYARSFVQGTAGSSSAKDTAMKIAKHKWCVQPVLHPLLSRGRAELAGGSSSG